MSRSIGILKAATFVAAFFFLSASVDAAASVKTKPRATPAATSSSDSKAGTQLETYQDLILKAQNLTLQQDRLQTSQVLIRGLQREARGSVAHKELVRSLADLTEVFYTEKAQNLFATAESQANEKPKEEIDQFLEALKTEDRNVTILKGLARAYLRQDDCDKADARVKQAEEVNPYSAEVKLLRFQTLSCQKNYDVLGTKLAIKDPELEPVEKFLKGLQTADLLRKKDLKKARAYLSAWETQAPDYPEVYFWKWELSKQSPADSPDRTAASKYSQLCQNLTPRKRKSFSLDVELCKGKEVVDAFLREKENQSAPPSREEPRS